VSTLKTDILEIALQDNDLSQSLIVERTDGHRSYTDLAWWRRQRSGEPPADTVVVHWLAPHETAIDVGCATGRGLELLDACGVNAFGIDTSATAVDLANRNGQRAYVADARMWPLQSPVDVVLALGGGAGICGHLDRLTIWLAHLTTWLNPGGRIILTSVDWRMDGKHRPWVEAARGRGEYPGNVTLRLRYGDHVGDWFPWLWVDPQTLTDMASTVGLVPRRTAFWGAKYGMELMTNGDKS
jgi:SAM-dependent methyltransferase